jgi:hypothetical protein
MLKYRSFLFELDEKFSSFPALPLREEIPPSGRTLTLVLLRLRMQGRGWLG